MYPWGSFFAYDTMESYNFFFIWFSVFALSVPAGQLSQRASQDGAAQKNKQFLPLPLGEVAQLLL